MGGCCCGNRILKMNKDFIINSYIIKNEQLSFKDPYIQSVKNSDKEETKKEKEKEKEKSLILDNLKTEMDDKKKNIRIHISSKTQPLFDVNNNISENKINKKKMLKKGSDRIHDAMNKLKLLTLKDMKNNSKFFT